MKLTDRQVRRLLHGLQERGDGVVIHGLRGRPSNRKLAARFQQRVVARIRERYADFGPTLAGEHLAQEGLVVSRETLRIVAEMARCSTARNLLTNLRATRSCARPGRLSPANN